MKHFERSVFQGRIVGLAAILWASTVAPAMASPHDIINGWVAGSAENAAIDIAYGAIDHDAANGKTTISDLSVALSFGQFLRDLAAELGASDNAGLTEGDISYAIRFPAITFGDLETDGGYLTASSVEADTMQVDITTDVDDADMGDSSIVYDDLRATNVRWAQFPAIDDDAARPVSRFLPLLRAAVDVSFSEMTVGAAQTRSELLDDQGEIIQRVGAIRMVGAERGDIAEMVVDSFKMTAPDTETGNIITMLAGPISATDYNYGTMIDVLFGEADAADYVTAIGEIRLDKIAFKVPQEAVALTVEQVSARDIDVRSPSMSILPFADSLILAAMADPDFEPDPEQLIGFVGAIYGAMRLGAFEISDIKIDLPDIKQSTVAAFGLRDLSAQGLQSLYVRGIDGRGLDGELVRYDEFEIADIGFPTMQALVQIGMMTDAGQEPPIELILQAIPTIGQIVNSGIRITIPEEDVDFALDGSVLEMTEHIGPIPTRVAMTIDGLNIDVGDLEEEARAVFEGLGYERIGFSADLLMRWNEALNDLIIDGAADLDDGGQVTFDGTIGSIPRLIFERPDQTGAMSVLGATFKQFNVRFEDASIVQRSLAFAAQQQGVSPETVRAQVLAITPMVLAELGDPALAADLTDAVSQLLDRGAPIALSVMAPAPLPIVALGMSLQDNPASIVQALEIEVISR